MKKFEHIPFVYFLLLLMRDLVPVGVYKIIVKYKDYDVEVSPKGLWETFLRLISIVGHEVRNGYYEKKISFRIIKDVLSYSEDISNSFETLLDYQDLISDIAEKGKFKKHPYLTDLCYASVSRRVYMILQGLKKAGLDKFNLADEYEFFNTFLREEEMKEILEIAPTLTLAEAFQWNSIKPPKILQQESMSTPLDDLRAGPIDDMSNIEDIL